MNWLSRTLCILLTGWAGAYGNSHTFFAPRQITTDSTFELALTDYDIYYAHADNLKLSIKPFFQHSCHGNAAAQFFLPQNKNCVAIREDGSGDINPLWFNIISSDDTQYSSTISFAPTRITYGSVFTFYASLDKWVNGLWLLANTAIIGVDHNMHVNETCITTTGTIPGFVNMCDGFNNPDFCYEKITCCGSKAKGGLDDIQLKIGYDFNCPKVEKIDHVALYGVLTIPTGNRPTSKYLFEPLVGSKHVTLGGGLNAGYQLCDHENNSMTILADFKYRYSLTAHERRSFDLCNNGDWSRYLLVVEQIQPLNSLPGNNFFTLPANVTPRSTIDFWLAFHHHYNNWDIEVGYNVWWRQKEKVTIRGCSNALSAGTVGVYNMTGLTNSSSTTADSANISQSILTNRVVGDATFIPLTVCDLNTESAAHPAAVSNKIYAAVAHPYAYKDCSGLLGLGGSYEFAHHTSALDQWALWTDIGLDF